ncbi:MAG: hypothetical protein ABSF40_12670 [Candidatus Acidiferrales bacterium]|jgi:uncharacterized membrane protein
MNITRIVLAALGAFVAYFVLGGLSFVLIPSLKTEFLKYPLVYRSQDSMKSVIPVGMAAMLVAMVAMVALAVIYAMLYRGGSGVAEGARFGALIGVFAICAFVIHNYVNLNIGAALTAQQSVAYSVEWVVTGIVIGLIYRPAH